MRQPASQPANSRSTVGAASNGCLEPVTRCGGGSGAGRYEPVQGQSRRYSPDERRSRCCAVSCANARGAAHCLPAAHLLSFHTPRFGQQHRGVLLFWPAATVERQTGLCCCEYMHAPPCPDLVAARPWSGFFVTGRYAMWAANRMTQEASERPTHRPPNLAQAALKAECLLAPLVLAAAHPAVGCAGALAELPRLHPARAWPW